QPARRDPRAVRGHGPAYCRARARPQAPRPAGRHARALVGRVRAHGLQPGHADLDQLRPRPPPALLHLLDGRRRHPARHRVRAHGRLRLQHRREPGLGARPARHAAPPARLRPRAPDLPLPGPRLPADRRLRRRAARAARVSDGAAWAEVLGRAHPLLVHLPIGLIAALAGLGLVAREHDVARARRPLAAPAPLAALATAGSGWPLGHAPDRAATPTLELHQTLGLLVAGLCVPLAVLARGAGRSSVAYRVALLLTLALLVPAGHEGSTLSHGEDWLL